MKFWNVSPPKGLSLTPTVSENHLLVPASCLLLGPPGSNWCFSFAPELVSYSAPMDLHRRAAYLICESCFFINQVVYHDLFVCP